MLIILDHNGTFLITMKEKALLALFAAPIGMVPACRVVNEWTVVVGLFAESFVVERTYPLWIGGLPWLALWSIVG